MPPILNWKPEEEAGASLFLVSWVEKENPVVLPVVAEDKSLFAAPEVEPNWTEGVGAVLEAESSGLDC